VSAHHVVNHFLVQTVLFLLDTPAQLALPRPLYGGACTHALVGSLTPIGPNRWGSDTGCSYATARTESGLRAVRGRPLPEQRSTLPVASILLSTVLTFNSSQRSVFIRKRSQYFCYSVELLLS